MGVFSGQPLLSVFVLGEGRRVAIGLDWRSGWGGGGDARMKQVSWRVGVLSGVGAG